MLLEVGADTLPRESAYDILISKDLAPARVSKANIREALIANIDGTRVAGVQVASLDTDDARASAYAMLAASGLAQPLVTEADIDAALEAVVFSRCSPARRYLWHKPHRSRYRR